VLFYWSVKLGSKIFGKKVTKLRFRTQKISSVSNSIKKPDFGAFGDTEIQSSTIGRFSEIRKASFFMKRVIYWNRITLI